MPGYTETKKDIGEIFKNIFSAIDRILDNSGKFVINTTCDTINSTINTFTNTREFTNKIVKKIPFFSSIPSPIGDFVVSVPTTIAKIANNLIVSFKSFLPFYATWDGFNDQTIISIKDLYAKIKELRELIEGKTILVDKTTQQITIIQQIPSGTPITMTPDINAQLAIFKNELLAQVAQI